MFFLISVKKHVLDIFYNSFDAFVTVKISGFFIVEKNGHRAVSR